VEPGFFPLDEQLGLQPGSLTPLQLQHLTHFASLHAFGQAASMLEQHHGVQVSASTSRRQTEELGACAEAVQNEQAQVALRQQTTQTKKGTASKEVIKQVLSTDGSFISLRGKVWAEVKTMVVGEAQEKTPASKQRPTQEVKTVHLSYFSRMTDADTFSEVATGELDRRGVFQGQPLCAVQDGAEWIQSVIDAHRADAVRILDFSHAAEYVSDIATLVRTAGKPLEDHWVAEQLHELKHHGPSKVLAEVARLLTDFPEIEDLEKKVRYLQKREALMQYPHFQQQGWPIGSGSVESANSCVVQDRLKGPGMHWEGRHVNPMLALRIGVCNDRWQETMQQAFCQRLLLRSSRRHARQQDKGDQLRQKVNTLVLRLCLLLPRPQLPPSLIPVSAHQKALPAPSASSADSRQVSRPAPSHPWRRYPRAKK
jgi:hypothetical protein